jgi:NadR type nicotinamide-nucleotide adenylyltransferase
VYHELFDKERVNVPISGTQLRSMLGQDKSHKYLPHTTDYFNRRILLLGGESSGKSTLAQALAAREYLNCQVVKEYGRELCEETNNVLRIQDYLHIAKTQIEREEYLGNGSGSYFLVCDTSPLTTYFYSLYNEGRADPKLKMVSTRSYYRTYLCAPDIPFVQDGSRKNEKFRQLQHEWYLAKLYEYKMPFLVVRGSIQERLEQIMQDLQY